MLLARIIGSSTTKDLHRAQRTPRHRQRDIIWSPPPFATIDSTTFPTRPWREGAGQEEEEGVIAPPSVLPKEDEIVDEKNTATAASLLFANLKISHLFREGGDETPTPFPHFLSDEHSKLDPIRVPALTFHQDIPNDDNEDDELLEYPNLYEDLALALQSLTEESDTDDEGLDQIDVAAVHDDDDDDLLLPEIELDFGDDTFLSEPLQDLDHIFAESSHNSDSIWQVNRVSNNNTIIPIDLHDDGHNISDDDDALLTKTVVDPFSPKTTSSIPPLSDEEAAAFYQDLDQALQSLSIVDDDPAVNWYCQPCTPSLPLDSGPSGSFSAIRWETLTSPPRIKPPPNLAAIDEDQAVVHQDLPQGLAASLSDPTFASLNKEQKKKSTKAGDVDELLDLSLLSIADGPLYSMDLMTAEEVEDLFTDGSSDEHIMEQIYDTTTASPMVVQPQQGPPPLPQRRSNLTIRPEAVSAALPFTSAFRVAPVEGTDKAILEQQETQNHGVLQERCCLGHKGTIFGVSFSECGNFLASASQDSTVCVWNVKTNALLATLKEHSQEHECLRVAWASSSWEASRLKRGADANDSERDGGGDDDTMNASSFSYMLATGGADGLVKVWISSDPWQRDSWRCVSSIDHSSFFQRRGIPENPNEDDDDDDDETGQTTKEERKRLRQEEEEEAPQIYALQFIDHWQGLPTTGTTPNSFLMSSSDDYLHLWELDDDDDDDDESATVDASNNTVIKPLSLKFREVMSLRFTSMQHPGYGVVVGRVTSSGLKVPSHGTDKSSSDATTTNEEGKDEEEEKSHYHFGGDRNPGHLIFVFDASYCSGNGLVGVALSDGSLRLLNGRGICLLVLQLPGCQSHLTALGWDSTGTRLATCVATGHVILWGLQQVDDPNHITAHCRAILEGGHELGRPLYGAKYCGGGGESRLDLTTSATTTTGVSSSLLSQDLLLSWGVDGRLVLWDSFSQGQVRAPLAILKSYNDGGDENDHHGDSTTSTTTTNTKNPYPIYTVDVSDTSVAVGGGGNDGGFLGIPVHLYDLWRASAATVSSITSAKKNDHDKAKQDDDNGDDKA